MSNGENISWFSYQSYKELGESSLSFGGAYGSYPGGGYVIDIHSQPDGRRLLETLQFRHNWLDLKTRALFVDFAFYNPNVDLFLITRCVMEFLPSGVVKGSATHRVLQAHPLFECGAGRLQRRTQTRSPWSPWDQLAPRVRWAGENVTRWAGWARGRGAGDDVRLQGLQHRTAPRARGHPHLLPRLVRPRPRPRPLATASRLPRPPPRAC